MNLAIKLTLDGLVKALRWKAHDLAEGAERRYLPRETVAGKDDNARRQDKRPTKMREQGHDGSGR
jgi:hypothetical protein